MMLQPISPRLSGEFSTQVVISWAAAVFAVSAESSVSAIAAHAASVVIGILGADANDQRFLPTASEYPVGLYSSIGPWHGRSLSRVSHE